MGDLGVSTNRTGYKRLRDGFSSAGLLDGQGGNMQNQPVRAREMYVCDPGMVFGYFDLVTGGGSCRRVASRYH